MDKKYKVVIGGSMSTKYNPRYVIIDAETGEILDDAQGYGCKDVQKAYAAYEYKHRDKSKDAINRKKEDNISKWCKEHHSFIKLVDEAAFEIAKGSWGTDAKMDTKLIKKLLNNNELEMPFSIGDYLRYWRKH